MAKMKSPEGATSCSFDGQEFEVDSKTNTVEVPEVAVGELLSHGFTIAVAEEKKGK